MDKEDASSGELIRRMASNDRAALGELYERYRSQVYGLALAILKNRSDAEDIMQSASYAYGTERVHTAKGTTRGRGS